MAEYLSAEYFAELRAAEQRPGNHKAVWTEAAVRELEMLAMRKEYSYEWNKIINLLKVEPRESAPEAYINIQKDRFSPEEVEVRWKDEDIAKWRALRDHDDTWEQIAASINSNHRPVNSQMFPDGFSAAICKGKAQELGLYKPRAHKPGAGRPALEWEEEWLAEMKAFGSSLIVDTLTGKKVKHGQGGRFYEHMKEKYRPKMTF